MTIQDKMVIEMITLKDNSENFNKLINKNRTTKYNEMINESYKMTELFPELNNI